MADTFDYETIKVGYYDEVFHRNRGMQSKWHQLKFDRIRRELGQSRKHLDIACGPGTLIGTLPDDISCIGVDIAVSQIDYAQKTYGCESAEFRRITEGPLPFEEGQFDTVSLVELIEHLDSEAVAALLTETCRVLAPKGRIVLSTPDYGGLWPVVEWMLKKLGEVSYVDQHICKFTNKRLKQTLQAAGFRNIDVRSYLFAAPFAAALGWGFADLVEKLEPAFIVDRMGLLLIATADAP
jgi:2-polyprenyl-3-methyl-5-hydroxy-6-metoxy-1,4-benzoquinol methylase